MAPDFRARVAAIADPLPGATRDDPWGGGHDVWKVGGKIFAMIGAMLPGLSVKCADADTAALLIEAGLGERAPYLHRSWIKLNETVADADLRHRILSSYRIIRAGLPAGVRKSLPEAPEA
jgi:predicted DNA-binding protein (MmcQ/YjbR family)